jgi:mannose-6-phosphate isomerase-like protein (cupin superfamily)
MHITRERAPLFELHGIRVVGFASPSRGAKETSMWRLAVPPHTDGALHSCDREEIFVALAGSAKIVLDGDTIELRAGEACIVPAKTPFSLANETAEPFEAMVALPVGGKASFPGGEPFTPPWAE